VINIFIDPLRYRPLQPAQLCLILTSSQLTEQLDLLGKIKQFVVGGDGRQIHLIWRIRILAFLTPALVARFSENFAARFTFTLIR
jgi:hypothetical protein